MKKIVLAVAITVVAIAFFVTLFFAPIFSAVFLIGSCICLRALS